jgi:hypothetical protein
VSATRDAAAVCPTFWRLRAALARQGRKDERVGSCDDPTCAAAPDDDAGKGARRHRDRLEVKARGAGQRVLTEADARACVLRWDGRWEPYLSCINGLLGGIIRGCTLAGCRRAE